MTMFKLNAAVFVSGRSRLA